MKTIKSISLLLGTFALMFSINLNAATETFSFEEEAYINDIPFNTGCVKAKYLYEKAISEEYDFEEEAYIEDIPFNTECVTANCLYQKAINEVFVLEEEPYVNDIPFNTYKLFKNKKCSSLTSRS